jgi:hypothetical protein
VLGLVHTPAAQGAAVMSPFYAPERTTLLPSDIARIRALYPPRAAGAPPPVLSADEARQYVARELDATLNAGLRELCEARPAEPLLFLANYLLTHNPNH